MAFSYIFFACLLLQTAVNFCDADTRNGCSHVRSPQLWKPFGDKCYRIVNYVILSWASASERCKSNYGGLLANGKTTEIKQFLAKLMAEMGVEKAWLGLSKRAGYYVWEWSDGERRRWIESLRNSVHYNFLCIYMEPNGHLYSTEYCRYRSLLHRFLTLDHTQVTLPWICEVDRDMSAVDQSPVTIDSENVTSADVISSSPTETDDQSEDETVDDGEKTDDASDNETVGDVEKTDDASEDENPNDLGETVLTLTGNCPDCSHLSCGIAGFKKNETTHCSICECNGP